MSRPSHFDQLRDAVQKEVSDMELRAIRCESFLEEIIRYQSGHGALPDEQQFLLWREDLKQTVAVRALKAGVGLPAQGALTSDHAVRQPAGEVATSPGRDHSQRKMDSPGS